MINVIKDNCIKVNHIDVSCYYETGERCGDVGTFQVESVILDTDFGEINVTQHVNQGTHFILLAQ